MIHNTELARQHESHVMRRQRLWTGRPPTRALALPPPPEEKPVVKSRPLWRTSVLYFDAHVIAWRDMVRFCMQEMALEMASEGVVAKIKAIAFRKPAKEIILEVLEMFPNVTIKDLKGPSRRRHIVLPRQLAMYELFAQRKDLSKPMIGQMFGGRDHTTVLSSIIKIERLKASGQL